MRGFLVACAFAGLWWCGCAQADTASPTPTPPPPTGAGGILNGLDCPALDISGVPLAAPGATPTPAAGEALLPMGSTVTLVINEAVGSSRFHRGDCFSISLAGPIVVDGRTLAPAGAPGIGQVVDSRRGGMGGTPGMIVLAARYVVAGNVRIPLRGFRITGAGSDNTVGAVTAAAVTSAFVPVVGMAALLIPGGDMTVPAGYRGEAHVRAPVALAVLPDPQPSSVAAPAGPSPEPAVPGASAPSASAPSASAQTTSPAAPSAGEPSTSPSTR